MAFRDRLGIDYNIILPNDGQLLYMYQHLYEKPSHPAPLLQLNHFCALKRRACNKNDYTIPISKNLYSSIYIVNNGCNVTNKIANEKTNKIPKEKEILNKTITSTCFNPKLAIDQKM